MRLFTAVYPSAEAIAHLELALHGVGGAAVTDPGAGLRWVPAEQRHVTLLFHGEVPDGAVPGYVDALGAAVREVEPFELALTGSGSFGGRTLWVGVAGAVPALRSLAATADDTAASAGLPAADRAGGRPHLTVARATLRAQPERRRRVDASRGGVRGGVRGVARTGDLSPLAGWAHALAVYRGPAWPVDTVHVVASRLGEGRSGGPLHEDVAVLPLAGRDAAA